MSQEQLPTIYMIGNTHFDPVWLWTWDEGMSSIRSTFRAALERMDEEPAFIYSFSCPPVFEWIRNVDPEMFRQIQLRVKQGRWELVEGWWLQPDCIAACGESYARQGLYGQRYLLKHFGQISRSAFNIDSFGHSAMLPQILSKSGIRFYSFTRPEPREKALPGQLFRWESPDGSSVLAWRDESGYLGDVEKRIRDAAGCIDELGHDIMLIYGVTNHGGAPTRQAIATIKELGDSRELPCDVRFGTHDSFFAAQDTDALPVVRDELMTKWFGVFSNFPEVKQNNRRGEYALLNAEKAAVVAGWANGADYPADKLTAGWKDLMFNQFHDIIGGACIKQAYQDARNLHGRALQSANEVLHYALQSVTKDISLPASGAEWNVVVWNLNAFGMEAQIEAEVQWAWEFEWYKGPIAIVDEAGHEYPCQVIRERSVIPGFRSRFVFTATLPSLGYKAFQVLRRAPTATAREGLPATDYHLESQRYRVEICRETGGIASIYDKQQGRKVLGDGTRPAVLQDDGDTWAFNVSGFGAELGTFRLQESKLIEDGPVRSVICTKAIYANSYLEQVFTLYKDTDILDGSYRVFWREKHLALKLGFDTLLVNPTLTTAIPYGSIERKNDGVEMPLGEWLDLSGEGRGVSILTDSLFSYDVSDSTAAFTVLRSAIFGDLRLPEGLDLSAEYEYLGQGITEGRWRLHFHDGNWRKAQIPQRAMQFCNPPVAVIETNHPGSLPQERSFAAMESQSTIMTVIKQAEEGDAIIVRAYEYAGKADRVAIDIAGSRIDTLLNRYEIKTLRFNQDGISETDILEIAE
ncbi:MAG: alpha-mannosidase [Anaerolineae bacterium]